MNYVRKSDEFARAAKESLGRSDWTAAVTNAMHSGLSMADALCVYNLGVRSADPDHKRAIDLLLTVDLEREELSKNSRHLLNLLKNKNVAEYEEKLLGETEATEACEQLERFRKWAKSKLV